MRAWHTAQNGTPSTRILQRNSARNAPQWARAAPSKRPTVPAATGLGLGSSPEQFGLVVVGTGVAAPIRLAHFVVARLVFAVAFGCDGSPPVQVLMMSPYSSMKPKNV